MPESPSAELPLPLPVAANDINIAPCLVSNTARFPGPFKGLSEGLKTGENSVYVQEKSREEPRQRRFYFPVPRNTATGTDRAGLAQVTIDVLPDDLLLEIFDLYREEEAHRSSIYTEWGWTTLAHVCRRWQGIILASPSVCTCGLPVIPQHL